MKKKVTNKNDEYKPFLTYVQYFATGEGLFEEFNFCYADTKQEAIEKHLDRFNYVDKSSKDYFRPGVIAYNFNTEKAKKLLTDTLVNGDNLYIALKEAGMDFHLRFHYNYS